MQLIKPIFKQTQQNIFWLIVFWSIVFVLNMGPQWEQFASMQELIETVGSILFCQMSVSVIVLYVLVPNILDKDRQTLFALLILAVLMLMSQCLIGIRYFYIEPNYPNTYANLTYVVNDLGIGYRIFSPWAFKYIILSKMPQLFFPTALLLARQFYRKQRDMIALKEKTNQAELKALKNQLNPHFLFNTLNNLYFLALKKSDHTPVVIEKLANILDYLVYRCNDPFVSINSEIALLQNYIDLECLRQSERLKVQFETQLNHPQTIAPLVLLNLVENACKHSTANELNTAKVNITLTTNQHSIEFTIKNSIPNATGEPPKQKSRVGMSNMKKQLTMLYQDRFELSINNTESFYQAILTIEP